MNKAEILKNLNIEALNEMQIKAFDAAQKNPNIILLSPTGSGKTVAFLMPLLEKLDPTVKGVQAVILVPTRELALQIEAVFKKMGTPFKINSCYGGHSTKTEIKNFSTPPAVLVGTPGRVAFHIEEFSFNTETVTSYVVDEFDKALEMGFQTDMDYIINSFEHISFRMLTSATALKKIPEFTGIENPERIHFLKKTEVMPDLTFSQVISTAEEKLETVIKLIGKIGKDTILIFCNHRDAVTRISETLTKKGVANSAFHGGMLQEDRERAIMKFRNKSCHILIATDLAARGLDIPEIGHVIHYQIPPKEDAFIHRNGRTARMKASGKAYVMITRDENIEFINPDMPIEDLEGNYTIDNKTDFKTIYISAGKKDKVNKGDIVGYLIKTGGLTKEDIGVIDVRDTQAFVAVNTKKVKALLTALVDTRLKNKRVKIEIARD
ncbi:DEAD/DEAH box helicase [Myroides odoratimimus]|uniref:DEAD/DEAH box helicase n=1 Tax=Myroides odoratimimus TaxID=76832 RepID=UPI00257537C6|nr:DEAD/DEAH box helicase [Myroides odoratimimus]MDM1496920.1 DEAD/DEAH box helicase [Myroides odoratimimus]MDM1529966.1 DEAD/DEAH box helicase [Myroides odoratimimus]